MYKIYGLTDVGKVREMNEDGFVLNDVLINDGDYYDAVETNFIAAICDGMGGEKSGELASFLALEAFVTSQITSKEDIQHLVNEKIQQALFDHMEVNPETKGMGTTIAGILCKEHNITVFHIGDSRVYRFRDGFIKQLTKDHSLVEMLYETGQISYEEKRTHPQRNVILRALGQKNAQVELLDLPNKSELDDFFLICSDGLTEYVTEDELENVLEKPLELDLLAKELVQLAIDRGGADNITVVLIKRVQ